MVVRLGILLALAMLGGCFVDATGLGSEGGAGASTSSGTASGAGGVGAEGAGGVAPSGGGSSVASGGAGGAGGDCSMGPAGDYTILAKGPGTITIDGACDEPAWGAAQAVPFQSTNPTNNAATCKLLWEDGSPDRAYGCCTVQDTELAAFVTIDDADFLWDDDAIEYYLKGDTTPVRDAQTTKVFISANETVQDLNCPGGNLSAAWDANVVNQVALSGTLNDGANDTGYVIEWRQDLAFDATPELLGLCQLILNDRDSTENFEWIAWGDQTNDPAQFGTCKYSCNEAAP